MKSALAPAIACAEPLFVNSDKRRLRFGVTRTLSECLCTHGLSHELIEVDEKLLNGIEVRAIEGGKMGSDPSLDRLPWRLAFRDLRESYEARKRE